MLHVSLERKAVFWVVVVINLDPAVCLQYVQTFFYLGEIMGIRRPPAQPTPRPYNETRAPNARQRVPNIFGERIDDAD